MDKNAPDTFGKGLLSFLVIYLDCNFSVYRLIPLLLVWMASMESWVEGMVQSSKMWVNVGLLKNKSCLH